MGSGKFMWLKSNFFITLENQKWWWVDRGEKDIRAEKQLSRFDDIAYAIEQSSDGNKRVLDLKLKKLIQHIARSSPNLIAQKESRVMSLVEIHPSEQESLKHSYAEATTYCAIFSEMKVFDELTKIGLGKIQFIDETPDQKTPDLLGDDNGTKIFVEVKFINPPEAEEKSAMAGLVCPIEVTPNCWDKVKKKLFDHLENAKDKFTSVNAYKEGCKRWVYMDILWSSHSKSEYGDPEKLIDQDLICELQKQFGIELKFLKTFE